MNPSGVIVRSYEFNLVNTLPEETVIKHLEQCARICYKSEAATDIRESESFLSRLWKLGHHSIFEHVAITAFIVCDRGLLAELTRHRLASFSVESTRYCDYQEQIEFIVPGSEIDKTTYKTIANEMAGYYRHLRKTGDPAQIARAVLPNMLATRLYMTANVREWAHVLELRFKNEKAHPDMRRLMKRAAVAFVTQYPILFGKILGLDDALEKVDHDVIGL
jgi:thymidylate synthase (FAD)